MPLLAALLLAACYNDDDPAGQPLPPGEHPMTFTATGIALNVETKATTDNNWQDVAQVSVQVGSEVKAYDVQSTSADSYQTATLTSQDPFYWQSTAPVTVSAWYPCGNTQPAVVVKANQSQRADYDASDYISATGTMKFGGNNTLQFTHRTAKVVVKPLLAGSGVSADELTDATITLVGVSTGNPADGNTVTPYADGNNHFALLPPQDIAQDEPFIQVTLKGGATYSYRPDKAVTLQEGCQYTYTITVKKTGLEGSASINTWDGTGNDISGDAQLEETSPVPADAEVIDLASGSKTISMNGDYVVRGSAGNSLTISSGCCPTIYLENANISASTPIRITENSTATIHVTGGNSAVTSTSGTGILVEKGSTLIITSESTDNVITVRGKNNDSSNDYPGIGGNESGDCGTIRIENVTVHAYGDGTFACAPGIGPSQNYFCEGIIINEAVVYAYGTGSDNLAAPGIGSGMHNFSAEIGAIPKIEITHSTIHAVRGGVVADYIGRAGWTSDSASSEVNPGTGGSIKSSTVYCHTRDTDRSDMTMEYNDQGVGTKK